MPTPLIAYLSRQDHFDDLMDRFRRFKIASDNRSQALTSKNFDPAILRITLEHPDLQLLDVEVSHICSSCFTNKDGVRVACITIGHLELVPPWINMLRKVCVFAYGQPGGQSECFCRTVEAGDSIGLVLIKCILEDTAREFEDQRIIQEERTRESTLIGQITAAIRSAKAERPPTQMLVNAGASYDDVIDTARGPALKVVHEDLVASLRNSMHEIDSYEERVKDDPLKKEVFDKAIASFKNVPLHSKLYAIMVYLAENPRTPKSITDNLSEFKKFGFPRGSEAANMGSADQLRHYLNDNRKLVETVLQRAVLGGRGKNTFYLLRLVPLSMGFAEPTVSDLLNLDCVGGSSSQAIETIFKEIRDKYKGLSTICETYLFMVHASLSTLKMNGSYLQTDELALGEIVDLVKSKYGAFWVNKGELSQRFWLNFINILKKLPSLETSGILCVGRITEKGARTSLAIRFKFMCENLE